MTKGTIYMTFSLYNLSNSQPKKELMTCLISTVSFFLSNDPKEDTVYAKQELI